MTPHQTTKMQIREIQVLSEKDGLSEIYCGSRWSPD